MKTNRLIVCFDIPGPSIKESYAKLEKNLRELPFVWETSDEAYDEDGNEIDPKELQQAILEVLQG